MMLKKNKINPLDLDLFLSLGFSLDEAHILLKNEQKKQAANYKHKLSKSVDTIKLNFNCRAY